MKYCSGCHKKIPDNICYWVIEKLFFCGQKCWTNWVKNKAPE